MSLTILSRAVIRSGLRNRRVLSAVASRIQFATPQRTQPGSQGLHSVAAKFPKHVNNLLTKSVIQQRLFKTEGEYHGIADDALDHIQDAIDEALDSTTLEYEVTLASGVLTLSLPPHGTWVVNKQTPNQQLWWSSPLSGPKRYEYDEADKLWFSTKDGLSLGPFLVQELRHVYPQLPDFEINV
jgi:frataxin